MDTTIVVATIAALPGIIVGLGAIRTARTNQRAQKHQAALDYVSLTEQSTKMIQERMVEVKGDHERCQRNIVRLRAAMATAGLAVPDLE